MSLSVSIGTNPMIGGTLPKAIVADSPDSRSIVRAKHGQSSWAPSSKSVLPQQLFGCHTYVACDLAQEGWRNIATCVEWQCGPPTVGMTILTVRSSLSDFDKSQLFQKRGNFPGFQYRQRTHCQATWMVWMPTNSDSRRGSPSSSNISTTSCRFCRSSSRLSPWLCAPGHPGNGSRPERMRRAVFGMMH